MADLATANATEEEKLKVMMSQSGEGFDPSKCVHYYLTTSMSNYHRYPTKPVFTKQPTGQIRLPPPTYVCFRCGQRGQHWFKMCPTQGVCILPRVHNIIGGEYPTSV